MRAQLTIAIAAITAISASHALAQTATSSAQSGSSSATKAPYACGDDAERHRFDFWLGAWNVTTEGGTKVGESVIETASNGCAILENWAGARGGRGKSLIFFMKRESSPQKIVRLTFTPIDKDTVRQHSEMSEDGGQTWKTEYDFYYHRKQ